MKGQSPIIGFILFFLIGLAIFISISGFFKGRLDFFTNNIVDVNRKLVNSYFSSLAINEIATCKQCDEINITTKLENVTAGFLLQVKLNQTHLAASSQPGGKEFSSDIHKFLPFIPQSSGSANSNKPIILSYTKNQNRLRVLQ